MGGALTALFLISSWALAVRLLLLESQAHRFWLVWVLGTAAFVVLSGAGSRLWVAGVSVNSVFLAIRLYRPFSRLTHARRVRAFFLGLAAFSLLSWGWFQNVCRFSLVSLQVFWVCVLLHIFFKARLHSVKIRAKLTASTILIAGVPILIVLIMFGAAVLSLMGESQAARAAKVMKD